MNRILYCGLLLLLSVTLATAAEPVQKAEAILGDDGVQRLTIESGSYFYRPNYIIVQANVPVELTVSKDKRMVPHDFVIEAPEAGIDVRAELSTGGTVIRFTPTAAGTYPILCTKKLLFFESHAEKGMEGVLEVRP
jgi:plastocyanin domain-containing protein